MIPVTITAENGNSLSTYGFLDNGCTETHIDHELEDQLNLEGNLQQIGIKTIRRSEEWIESQWVSFPHSPMDRCGKDIEVNKAYVHLYALPDLNQSGQTLQYRAVLSEYISKGYGCKFTSKEAAKESSRTWYLPQHPVMNPNKPGKLRIIFDTAAEYEGTCLNKGLLQSPDMTNSLVGVLQHFCQGKAVLAADAEALFHQVHVPKEDQDALCFLWETND